MTSRNAGLLRWWGLTLAGGVAILVGAATLDLRILAIGAILLAGGIAGMRWRLRRSFPAYAPRRRRR